MMEFTETFEVNPALSLYDKVLFWEYSEKEIQTLPAEFVIPRVTRYGSLNDIIRLFSIYHPDLILKSVNFNKELDTKEMTFLKHLHKNATTL